MGYRFFTISVFLVALLAVRASGTETLTVDGSWWNGLDFGQQLAATQAAADTYRVGYDAGAIALENKITAQINANSGRSMTQAQLTNLLFRTFARKPTFSKTFGTYIHGISDFYANYSNASSATIGSIIECLADHPEMSCDDVAKYTKPSQ